MDNAQLLTAAAHVNHERAWRAAACPVPPAQDHFQSQAQEQPRPQPKVESQATAAGEKGEKWVPVKNEEARADDRERTNNSHQSSNNSSSSSSSSTSSTSPSSTSTSNTSPSSTSTSNTSPSSTSTSSGSNDKKDEDDIPSVAHIEYARGPTPTRAPFFASEVTLPRPASPSTAMPLLSPPRTRRTPPGAPTLRLQITRGSGVERVLNLQAYEGHETMTATAAAAAEIEKEKKTREEETEAGGSEENDGPPTPTLEFDYEQDYEFVQRFDKGSGM
ncbi:hypothetical protein GGR56DRAFT_644468 [Xylariaceae sp. FL0804]|nr:hypothetical protein GGR56DRAFT_644468 [Xylariaceae sp. FL0804]